MAGCASAAGTAAAGTGPGLAAVTGQMLAAAGPVLAAGRHGHLVKLAGLVVLAVAVAAAGWYVVSRLIRHARSSPPPPPPPAPGAAPGAGATGTIAADAVAAGGGAAGGATLAVAAEHLAKTYQMGRVAVRALDDVSLAIGAGAMVCIMGKSGSGKSTLLRQLGLIDLPSGGRIYLHGREVTGLAERQRTELRLRGLGYVFQEYALLPELTAAENVYLPAMMAGQAPRQYRGRAGELLDLVGLGPRAGHRPKELSGGEQQRVAIARALVNEPGIVYADEPTANLDSASARTVMETLRKLNQTLGVTVLFVSHDPDDAQYASQLIHLRDGKLSDGRASGVRP